MILTTRSLTFRVPRSAFRVRQGMSMAEVLVALFLLALGTIAILTMFPLGMYHMGQALKDDRTAQAANQADAFMRMYWRVNVVENPNAGTAGNARYEPMVPAFDYPDSHTGLVVPSFPIALGNPTPPGTRLPMVTSGPSYPVFVDPMGWHAPWPTLNPSVYSFQHWAGGTGFYPRRSLNFLLNSPPMTSQRICSMLDGYGYDEGGLPASVTGVPGGQFERDLRYNWMWVLQRPDISDRNTAKMTVVVFDKRAFQFAPARAEESFSTQFPTQPFAVIAPGNVNYVAPGTAFNTIVMTPGTTTLQIPVGRGVPPVQKGGWIMDATYLDPTNPFVAGSGMRHAQFYRVVSVTDNPNNMMVSNGTPVNVPTTDIELQTPIRRLDGGTGSYPGTLMYVLGVSEVFERPNLRANEY